MNVSPADSSPRTTAGVLAFLTVLYMALMASRMTRHLWFDELFTFYIARQPDLKRLLEVLARTDLHPPFTFLLVRLFQSVLGTSEIVTRLPAALAFYLGDVAVFFFLKPRIGVWWSAAALTMFWSTPFITYAAEARPYGPLIGFFGLTLLAYGATGSPTRPRWAVPCLALGNIGMMLCHVLAPLSILPFWVAEVVRSVMRRRIDWPVQGAFLAAAPFALLYLPALSLQRKVWYPLPQHAGPEQAAYFFIRLGVFFAFPGLFAAIAAAVGVAFVSRRSSPAERRNPGGPAALAWSLCLLALPVAVNLLLMRNAAAFWDRYCITTAFGFYLLAAVMLARYTGFRRNSAIAALLALSAASLLAHYGSDSQAPYSTAAIRADLPLVAGDGLTFLEMDHYDTGGVQSRLYYLVDEASALRFSHSNIFESMPMLTGYFPIRSRVSSYSAFVAAQPHFLVLSRPDYLEEWVLPKLHSEGADIRRVQSIPAPNRPFDLYEVRLVH